MAENGKNHAAIFLVAICNILTVGGGIYFFFFVHGSTAPTNADSSHTSLSATTVESPKITPVAEPQKSPAVAESAATVRLKYKSPAHTELAMLAEGVQYFSNNKTVTIQNLPPKLSGLTFTRRPTYTGSEVEIHGESGSTVYLIASAGKTPQPPDSNWTLAGNAQTSDKNHTKLVIYRHDFMTAGDLTVSTIGWPGTVLAAQKLEAVAAPKTFEVVAPTSAPSRIDVNPMTVAVAAAPTMRDPLDDVTYTARFNDELNRGGPATALADMPIFGARFTRVVANMPGDTAGLRVGDILLAVDGKPTPSQVSAENAHLHATGPQVFDVISPDRPGHRLIKVEAARLGTVVEDCWLMEAEYIRDLPVGTAPSDAIRVAARVAQSDPELAESAISRALRSGGAPDIAPHIAMVDAIAAVALFNDSRYEDALAFALAAAAKLPADSRAQLDKIIVDSALATFRYPLAMKVAQSNPLYLADLGTTTTDAADFASLPHTAAEANPTEAISDFLDQTGKLTNLAPDVNGERKMSAYQIGQIKGGRAMPFTSPDGSYTLISAGPGDANVDFSANCHFTASDNGRSGYVKIVRIGFNVDGGKSKQFELYLDGHADVTSASDDSAPDFAPLDLHRLIGNDRKFDVRMTVVGDRYEFVIDGRRIFYGPLPASAAEATRKLTLTIQTVGVKGNFGDFRWRTVGPRAM